MIHKPMVFNYRHYVDLQDEVDRLKAELGRRDRDVNNLKIRLRISEADNEALIKQIKELESGR